jgi:ribosome assembly protein 4
VEILTSLEETLQQISESDQPVSYESALTITYQPLSVYRVRPVTRCVETMPGHTDAVIHVSYSPDGRRLASGGGDAAVRFWNVTTSLPSHTCLGHRNHILCATWTPDGENFISADKAGEIRVWDPRTGKGRGQPLKGHKKWVTSLSCEPYHCDPTCRRVASASKDCTVRVWDLQSGRCETVISGHSDSVESVKWGGAGYLYTCSRDRTIMVWEVDGHGRSQQKLLRTLVGHAHRINTLALSCDYVLRTGISEHQRGGVAEAFMMPLIPIPLLSPSPLSPVHPPPPPLSPFLLFYSLNRVLST